MADTALIEKAKKKIDSIYNLVINEDKSFGTIATKVSEDNASAVKEGKLNRFSFGQMVDDFSKVAFELQTIGDVSTPFQTKYGWHIVKLLNKYPVESFEKFKSFNIAPRRQGYERRQNKIKTTPPRHHHQQQQQQYRSNRG